MYNDDWEYAKVETKFKERAMYLIGKGYTEKELDELAYEIYMKEKESGSNEPK